MKKTKQKQTAIFRGKSLFFTKLSPFKSRKLVSNFAEILIVRQKRFLTDQKLFWCTERIGLVFVDHLTRHCNFEVSEIANQNGTNIIAIVLLPAILIAMISRDCICNVFSLVYHIFFIHTSTTITNHCLHVVCALGRHARELPARGLDLWTYPGVQPTRSAEYSHYAHLPLYCSNRPSSTACCW